MITLKEAFLDLLAEAEAECGPKITTPDKDAEFWAAQKNTEFQVPGVQRRIALARAVLNARKVKARLYD